MKTYTRLATASAACFLSFCLAFQSPAAVTVGHVENAATGGFLSNASTALTAGGVSVGFFAAAIPTSADWALLATQAISTAYATLTSPVGPYQFKDVRQIGTTPGTLDWDFPLTLGGTVSAINLTPGSAPQTGTKLFIMAFNSGTLANGFTLASEWAVVSANTWALPADNTGISLLLSAVDGAARPNEVLIGSDTSGSTAAERVNLKLAPPIPEPSSAILMGSGLLGLLSLRRRGKRS